MKDKAGILAEVVEIVVALEEGVRKLSSALAQATGSPRGGTTCPATPPGPDRTSRYDK
jgi:hypothetical protein